MKIYYPVGKGVSLLKSQAIVSYTKSDAETFDMDDDWIEKLASQYGAKQQAALRGDETTFKAASFWLQETAEHHWHEIITALKTVRKEEK